MVRLFVGENEVECATFPVAFNDTRKNAATVSHNGRPLKIRAVSYSSFAKNGMDENEEAWNKMIDTLLSHSCNAVYCEGYMPLSFYTLLAERGVYAVVNPCFNLERIPKLRKGKRILASQNAYEFVKAYTEGFVLPIQNVPSLIGLSFDGSGDAYCIEGGLKTVSGKNVFSDFEDGLVSVLHQPSLSDVKKLSPDTLYFIHGFPDGLKKSEDILEYVSLLEKLPNVAGYVLGAYKDVDENNVFDNHATLADVSRFLNRPYTATVVNDNEIELFNTQYFQNRIHVVGTFGTKSDSKEIMNFVANILPRTTRRYEVGVHFCVEGDFKLDYYSEDGKFLASETIHMPGKDDPEDTAVLRLKDYTYNIVEEKTKAWENILPARSYFVPCSSEKICDEENGFDKKSDRVFTMGDWDFMYVPGSLPQTLEPKKEKWTSISLPFTFEGAGLEPMKYTDGYPFEIKNEKIVADKKYGNTAGIFRKVFSVIDLGFRYVLSFGRFNGGITVYVNGQKVGSSMIGTAEFDVTNLLVIGENEVVFVLRKWNKLSYLSGNRRFLATGILGNISLKKLRPTSLYDYTVSLQKLGITYFANLKLLFQDVGFQVEIAVRKGEEIYYRELKDVESKVVEFSFNEKFLPYNHEVSPLYDIYVSVMEKGYCVECTKIRTGFAVIREENGVVTYNDDPLKIRGIVYNPIYNAEGKLMKTPEIKEDLALIKRYGFNTVQPTFPVTGEFASLCQEIGLYVVAALPIHTEGIAKGNAKNRNAVITNPAFAPSVRLMCKNNFEELKAFSNVLMFYIGEDYSVPLIRGIVDEMQKHTDKFVTAVGNGRLACVRYPSLARTLEMINENMNKKPIFFAEYAPNDGVGCADVKQFEELIVASPCCLGGCVSRFGNDIIGKEGFRDDGLFLANRVACAGAENIKYLYRKVKSDFIEPNIVEISNNQDYADTSDYMIFVVVQRDGKILSRVQLEATVLPHSTRRFEVYIGPVEGDTYVNVDFYDRISGKWLYTEQHHVHEEIQKILLKKGSLLRTVELPDYFEVRYDCGVIRFDKRTGSIVRYTIMNKEVIKPESARRGNNGFVSNIYRPFVRNILSGTSKMNLVKKGFSWSKEEDRIIVCVESSFYAGLRECYKVSDKYVIHANGVVEITSALQPKKKKLPLLDCFGKQLRLHNAFGDISYYGCGPEDTYVDMKEHACVGLYPIAVNEVFDRVYHKQECGNRLGVQYAVALDKEGDGIFLITKKEPFQLRVSPLSDKEIAESYKTDEIKPQSAVYIDVNAVVSGIGNAKKGYPLSQYTVVPGKYVLQFAVVPVYAER